MLKNYLLVALRGYLRNKTHFFLNVLGLALGIAVSLLILLYVVHEQSFDHFHENLGEVYQVTYQSLNTETGVVTRQPFVPPALGPAMVRDFAGVKDYVRFWSRPRFELRRASDTDSTTRFIEHGVRFTDPSIFRIFSFRLLKGNPETALDSPSKIVITESMAEKYFGGEDPMGQTLSVDGKATLTVAGVAENPPSASSITFDFLIPLEAWPAIIFQREVDTDWNSFSMETFLWFEPNAPVNSVAAQLPEYVEGRRSVQFPGQIATVDRLEPLSAKYLYSETARNSLGPKGNPKYLRIFSLMAFLILLVAALNYLNLTTARSMARAREVGVRKSVGASRAQLVRQFFSESLVMVLLALPLALMAVAAALPWFRNVLQYDLDVSVLDWPSLLVTGGSLLVLLILLAGFYPAMVLSRFQPVHVLKGQMAVSPDGRATWLRKALITFQFAVSVALIATTVVVQRQVDYIQSATVTLETDHIVNLNLFQFPSSQRRALKEALLTLPAVKSAATSFTIPYQVAASVGPRDHTAERYAVDPDFVETYGLKVVAGRDFSYEHVEADRGRSILVNEALVRDLELEDPVGSFLQIQDKLYTVVGVLEDFHFESLHHKVRPLYMTVTPEQNGYLSLRVAPGDTRQIIADITQVWGQFTDRAMEYTFLDEAFDKLYRSEDRLAKMFNAFSLLAIFISCLGVFGLSGYIAERRGKELAIRKVFGASSLKLVELLSKEYVWLMLAAIAIALPVADWALDAWMANFEYRVAYGMWQYLLAGTVPMAICLAVAAFQSMKASRVNPAMRLRNE